MKKKSRATYPTGKGAPVLIGGARTAFVKSFGVFEDCDALDLFSQTVDQLCRKINLPPEEINEIIAGSVIPQTKNPNIARDTILNLGLSEKTHGYTMNRACTSSLQAIINASTSIRFGHPDIVLAGGVECLSDVPVVYSQDARKFMVKLSKARSTTAKLNLLKNFKAKAWLPRPPALEEPLTGLSMGQHAEIMAQKNDISRSDQDSFAVDSHRKAAHSQEMGFFDEEIIPVWPAPKYNECVKSDNIIRKDTSIEAMGQLKTVFEKPYGSLTAGNSSPLTDGAAVSIIADEERALSLGLKPIARILDFDFVGVDPNDQLLIGPAITVPRLLQRNGMTLGDIDRFEIHEAFAAQTLSCIRSMASSIFCEKHLGMSQAFGELPMDKLNVNGGALAIGHPFAATGSRLMNTLALELQRSDSELGVIGICAAGGMAGSLLIERIGG
ncbi:MAG: acetyl-CoA C-acyltransferase [Oligoflexales bacterium]